MRCIANSRLLPRRRSEGGPSRGGFGLSFNGDPESDSNQSALRIHPNESPPGVQGCLGLNVPVEDLRDFYDQLKQAIEDNGGPIPLYVR